MLGEKGEIESYIRLRGNKGNRGTRIRGSDSRILEMLELKLKVRWIDGDGRFWVYSRITEKGFTVEKSREWIFTGTGTREMEVR